MTTKTLTLHQLNRAFLQRQLLLERQSLSITEATEHLIGLQSQIPNPPYIGLWTRLTDFQRDDLTQLMQERKILRAAMMRSTLHLITDDDHQRFRPVIEPALARGLRSFFGKKAKELDVDKLVSSAKLFIEEVPRSTGELKEHLLTVEPDADPDAMAYVIRTHLPLVQVPPGGTWGAGTRASYATAEQWLSSDAQPATLRDLFARYLRAYGPASMMDFQTWTGMTSLKNAFKQFQDKFVTYEDENGRELFDLPDLSIPDSTTPAPIRFIPEYDNLLIAHADRNRIIADDDRKKVFLSAGRVLGTILVDGFVSGTWKIKSDKGSAALTISPFNDLNDEVRGALIDEGDRLLRFVEDTADDYTVTFQT